MLFPKYSFDTHRHIKTQTHKGYLKNKNLTKEKCYTKTSEQRKKRNCYSLNVCFLTSKERKKIVN